MNLQLIGNKIFELSYKGKKMHQKRPIMYCKKLYNIIKAENYEIVHVHGSSSMMFMQLLTAKIAGVRVRIAHSRNTSCEHKLLNVLFKPFFRMIYTNAFACGKEAGEWLFGKKENFVIIPNGKNCEMFKFQENIRGQYRKKHNLNDRIVIGHIGNFNYQKNHEFLIDIFYELSKLNNNYYLILAGKGTLEKEIHDKIIELGLQKNVIFLGQVTVKEVANWLQAMDIMVFPSRFEGFPNVLIEWQIAGLPCIISDKITKDVKVTDLVKFISLDKSPKYWAEEIIKTKIQDRNLIKNKVINQIKEHGYDIKENAKRLEKIYENLIKEVEKVHND